MAQEKLKVFFDLDGTLLDVSERNYRVYCEVTEQFHGTPLAKDEYWELKRKKAKWPELLPFSKLDPSIEAEFLKVFIAKIEDPKYLELDILYPDTLNVLQEVSSKCECRLVSLRRNEANLLEELDRLKIKDAFVEILSGHSESDGYDKKIDLIKSRLGSDKGVIIGDTEADIITGKNLGLTTIAVLSGIRDQKFLEALDPDYLLDNVGDILTLPIFADHSPLEGLYI